MRIQPRNQSSSLKRIRWGWFPANIAISDISLKTRFFGLNFSRKKYPWYLSQLKHDEGKAFEIGVFSEGVRHFERQFQVDGDVACNRSMDRWSAWSTSYKC